MKLVANNAILHSTIQFLHSIPLKMCTCPYLSNLISLSTQLDYLREYVLCDPTWCTLYTVQRKVYAMALPVLCVEIASSVTPPRVTRAGTVSTSIQKETQEITT